jgi:hypothetical protein
LGSPIALQPKAFTIGESKGIGEGLLDQPPHQPPPIERVPRSFHLIGTAVKIQGAADADQPIQHWRIQIFPVQQGIEKHGPPKGKAYRPKGYPFSGESQLMGQLAAVLQNGEEIPGAVSRIGALGQEPPWPCTAQIQPHHPKAQEAQGPPEPALAPIITASTQSMDHHHQPMRRFSNLGEI